MIPFLVQGQFVVPGDRHAVLAPRDLRFRLTFGRQAVETGWFADDGPRRFGQSTEIGLQVCKEKEEDEKRQVSKEIWWRETNFLLTVINYGQDASPIPSSGHPTEEEEQRNPEIYRLRDTFEWKNSLFLSFFLWSMSFSTAQRASLTTTSTTNQLGGHHRAPLHPSSSLPRG